MARSSPRRPHGVQADKPVAAPSPAVTTTPTSTPMGPGPEPEVRAPLGGWRVALWLWLLAFGALVAFELVPFVIKVVRQVF